MSSLIVTAHTVLYINGMPYANVSEITPSITSPQKVLRGIDYLPGIETAPMPLEYTVSTTVYRRKNHGGLEGDGLVPGWDVATRGKFFSAIIMDRVTSEILFESQKNQITSQAWRIAPKSLLIGQITWVGLGYSNDSETLFG
jgi:hypothetical protein